MLIFSGRRINDGMGIYIVQQAIKKVIQNDHSVKGLSALVLGITFKENVPDLRNSRVPDMVSELQSFGIEVDVHDPMANPEEAFREYGIQIRNNLNSAKKYGLILIAVAHDAYRKLDVEQLKGMTIGTGIVVDIKHLFARGALDSTGITHWRI